jgi:hypothetical protein
MAALLRRVRRRLRAIVRPAGDAGAARRRLRRADLDHLPDHLLRDLGLRRDGLPPRRP